MRNRSENGLIKGSFGLIKRSILLQEHMKKIGLGSADSARSRLGFIRVVDWIL